MDEEVRWYKGPPVMTLSEHWNYDDDKDFPGGYAFMSQGPLPISWATSVARNRGMWGLDLRRYLMDYNRMAGFKIVGEVEPQDANRVDLADAEDALGLKVPRVTFSYSDNDRRLKAHARRTMRETLGAAGASDLWEADGTAHLMGGCPAWARTPERASPTPTGGRGTSPTCGSATAHSSRPAAG